MSYPRRSLVAAYRFDTPKCVSLSACSEVSPADWIVASALPWPRLVTFGPSGFAAYARLRHLPDPAYEGQSENDADVEGTWWEDRDQLATLLQVLGLHTTTPDCYVCIWEGYTDNSGDMRTDPGELPDIRGGIDTGTLQLLANPDQWQALLDDPSLVAAAVEEILRVSGTGGGGVPRWARTDIEVGGVTIRAGEAVLLDLGAANHDERQFGCPARFDIARTPSSHLTFGHGTRYCLGAPLARIELQAVFVRLRQRFPTMRLAVPIEDLQTRSERLTGGLTELPVTW